MKEHFTVEQAAEFLDVSTRTIYSYVKDGKISARKIANKLHLSKKDVEQLKAPAVAYNPATQVAIDKSEYESLVQAKAAKQELEKLRQEHSGLLVRLGQLETEVRFAKDENQRLLADLRFRDKPKVKWWLPSTWKRSTE